MLAACIVDASGRFLAAAWSNQSGPIIFITPTTSANLWGSAGTAWENKLADEILLADKLSSLGQLELVGGQSALIALTERIDSTGYATHWLSVVKEKALLRNCIRVAFEMIDGANDLQGEVDDFLSNMEQRVCSLSDEQSIRSSIPLKEPIDDAMAQIKRMLDKKDSDGLLTGYKDLDNLTNGLQPAEMVVLAARPSVGKTSLAMNIVENIAFSPKYLDDPKNILVFSLEMSATSLAMRLICGRAKINMNSLRRGFVGKNQAEKLNEVSKEFQDASIWVDDTSGLTINQIRAKARRVKPAIPLA